MAANKKHPPEWYCGAKKKESRGGGPCTNRAGSGTDHLGVGACTFHGGDTPNANKAAAAKILDLSFHAWLAENGKEGEPLDVVATILSVLRRTERWYTYIGEVVGGMSPADWQEKGPQGAVQLSVYVAALERAQERMHKHLADVWRLGLEERLAAVTVRQGEAMIAALAAGLAAVGLAPEDQEVAIDAAARHLEVAAGQPKALTA